MKKASPLTLINVKRRAQKQCEIIKQNDLDLNIVVVTFNTMKQSEKNIKGGDPYTCKGCRAILNKYSTVLNAKQLAQRQQKPIIQLKNKQSLWKCQFCGENNAIKIDQEQIPKQQDIIYLVQSQLENMSSQNQSTMVFCIDSSGSMNTTTQIQGKIGLKFDLISQQQIQMLRQFMEPGDEAQFNYIPGQSNNKTYISRKQCILSAIQYQLSQLRKTDPHKKVGFISFNNQVTVIGDNKTPTVNILGDKLHNRQSIVDSLAGFKLVQPLDESFDSLIKQLNKQDAKGQTALGPALISAIQVASKGSPGSTIILCTDGLANIGLGVLDPLTEENKKFYEDLALLAKQRNISVSIMTIKGQGCKMDVIGKLAQFTNGNMKVVNPQKLAEDFSNVLKDQVIGLNVSVTIQLHKAMNFRNQDPANLSQNATILKKKFANATVNTKISFEYQIKCEEDLKQLKINLQQLKKVPFQTQIFYTSPRGGKFLRVISSQSATTMDKKQIYKNANIGVAHQRVAAITTNLYSKGDHKQSVRRNQVWSNYLMDNFQEQKYQKKQMAFMEQNERLNKAIKHKTQKEMIQKKAVIKQEEDMQEEALNKSLVDSDQDQAQLMDNLMQKRSYKLSDDQMQEQKPSKKQVSQKKQKPKKKN